MTNTNLAADLRQMADLIDANPELGLHPSGNLTLYARRHDSFLESVRAVTKHGTGRKERNSSGFSIRVRINPTFEIIAIDYDDSVACELVQTGTRTVERPILVEQGVEVVTEPIMEWVCPPSILAAAS